MNETKSNIERLEKWLDTLQIGIKPSLKINHGFSVATVVVDVGTPKNPIRLTSDEHSELTSMMRDVATDLTGRKNVRVSFDNNNGVYYTN